MKHERSKLSLTESQAKAIAELWKEHSAALHAMLQRWCGDPEQAADYLQELFHRVAQDPSKLKGVSNPRAFLTVVARRIAIDSSRQKTAQERRNEQQSMPTGPSQVISDSDMRAAIARAFKNLPQDQRRIAELRLIKGKAFEEIAKIEGISINTAASRFRYALDKIQSELRPYYDELIQPMKNSNFASNSPENQPIIQPLDPKRVPSVAPGLEGAAAFAADESVESALPEDISYELPEDFSDVSEDETGLDTIELIDETEFTEIDYSELDPMIFTTMIFSEELPSEEVGEDAEATNKLPLEFEELFLVEPDLEILGEDLGVVPSDELMICTMFPTDFVEGETGEVVEDTEFVDPMIYTTEIVEDSELVDPYIEEPLEFLEDGNTTIDGEIVEDSDIVDEEVTEGELVVDKELIDPQQTPDGEVIYTTTDMGRGDLDGEIMPNFRGDFEGNPEIAYNMAPTDGIPEGAVQKGTDSETFAEPVAETNFTAEQTEKVETIVQRPEAQTDRAESRVSSETQTEEARQIAAERGTLVEGDFRELDRPSANSAINFGTDAVSTASVNTFQILDLVGFESIGEIAESSAFAVEVPDFVQTEITTTSIGQSVEHADLVANASSNADLTNAENNSSFPAPGVILGAGMVAGTLAQVSRKKSSLRK